MPSIRFGSPKVYAKPLTDITGAAIALPTSILLPNVTEFSLDMDVETKELEGDKAFALDVALAKRKLSGKIKMARRSIELFSKLFYGQTPSTSSIDIFTNNDTPQAIPSSSTYTITITIPNSGTYLETMSVRSLAGDTLTQVASAPAQGQYSVASTSTTVTYTFNSSDGGAQVYTDFKYSYTATKANSILILNPTMGSGATFALSYVASYRGQRYAGELYNCIANKIGGVNAKNNDYDHPEVDFMCFADVNGNVQRIVEA
jgi:hypothetical protein